MLWASSLRPQAPDLSFYQTAAQLFPLLAILLFIQAAGRLPVRGWLAASGLALLLTAEGNCLTALALHREPSVIGKISIGLAIAILAPAVVAPALSDFVSSRDTADSRRKPPRKILNRLSRLRQSDKLLLFLLPLGMALAAPLGVALHFFASIRLEVAPTWVGFAVAAMAFTLFVHECICTRRWIDSPFKKCHFCQERIRKKALVCRYCGSTL